MKFELNFPILLSRCDFAGVTADKPNEAKRFIFVLVLILLSVGIISAQDFKADFWFEDFAQLKQEMAAHYANLEWAVEKRGLDLKQLSETTEARLRQARNDGEAQAVIESFLNAFGDGHLNAQWEQNTSSNPSSDSGSPQTTTQTPLCQRLGYKSENLTPRILFSRLKDFREIKNEDSKYFSVGVLRITKNKNVGVIRIPLFSEYLFPDLCEQASSSLGLTKDSACDDDCDDLVERKSANLLTAALGRQIETLKRQNIQSLLIDITGNGGGTNWTEAAARTLSAKPLRSPRQRFIRHEHWTRQLKRRLELIEGDARKLPVNWQKDWLQAADILRKAITESQQPCRLETIWQNQKPNCSLVVAAPTLYPQSILSYAKSGSLPELPSSRYIFYPSRYEYREGAYAGKLLILVDERTGSSAEYFTAMLRDNNAATIIGEPTSGSGCGYTNRGIPTILKNSRGRIRMPDCVRLRADGSNEVEGITPDVLIPWRTNDSRYQRVNRVFDSLINFITANRNR